MSLSPIALNMQATICRNLNQPNLGEMKMNNNSDELLDPWEVVGMEKAKRFAAYFNRSPGGRLYILDKCASVSDASGNLRDDNDKEHFGELTGVPPQSVI